jgi:hypothetical protein
MSKHEEGAAVMDIARTAPDALKKLWKEKEFLTPKDVRAIEGELARRGYNFNDKKLMMALKSAKFLTRRGVKGNYQHVQKHPYLEEDSDER